MQLSRTPDDSWLFGWDPTPGIVSVWADRSGRALVWRRVEGGTVCEDARYRPWMFATSLRDLERDKLVAEGTAAAEGAAICYRELKGPEGSYRYLLSARDGRELERAICNGATARLGRPVAGVRELEDDYYCVGPTEQYLMATGRVCFRGMVYGDLHRLQFDLETTSLRPEDGRIFMIAVRDSSGFATVLEAPRDCDEARMIADLCALVREHDPDVIENHNLFGFDLPFLHERARRLGVPLALARAGAPPMLRRYEERVPYGRRRTRARFNCAGRDLIDTLDAVRRHDFAARDMEGHGLKAAARYFGVAAPERTYLAGAEVYRTYQRDPETVRRYALDDVIEVDGLSQRLLGAPFALAAMAPRRYESLASAGPAMGILEPMLVRAYLREGVALPRQAADSDALLGPHAGGAVHLFAGGLAQQAVKADIASMYPSIMRTFSVGPECDTLGVLLYLVGRLTDLRLHHKDAARAAAHDSAEAHTHHAVQAAMKILINSAYGYMGAGAMALFADRRAADAVTRHGREILGKAVRELADRGMALLEADTDGVFFAAPAGWTEHQERRLVADVAAQLPDGIRLEYEGRYRAMYVHEVKNYALLTYDGELIVRGGALRSSRSEIFGERFLHRALGCALVGDVEGVERAYAETVQALRERRFTAMEVSTPARLTKTSEEYMRARRRMREAPYEAMLNAGRTSWRAGKRIRFYRATDAVVLLPESNEAPFGDTGEADQERPPAAGEPRGRTVRRGPDARDYDVAYYLGLLHTTYVGRLRKAFRPEDFDRLFRRDAQIGLFDEPVSAIEPLWIRCAEQ